VKKLPKNIVHKPNREQWEVEHIVGRMAQDDGWHYKVQWVSFPESANQWLPLNKLKCDDLIEEFELNYHEL